MAYQNILLEQKEAGIYLLTINRPKALNALNGVTLDEFFSAVCVVADDPDARVLLVTGSGAKSFVAGADIAEMQPFTAMEGKVFSEKGVRAFRALETLQVPVIAVVNGFALGGGCELAMACDWILASENAAFGQPEVNLGVTPGFGGTQRLTRLVGRGMAMELLMTGRQVKADEALRIGLATHVYPAAELMDKAVEMARLIATKGPVATQLTKQAVQRGQDMDLDNACVLETDMFGLAFSTQDQKEGMAAFLEKRRAQFTGK